MNKFDLDYQRRSASPARYAMALALVFAAITLGQFKEARDELAMRQEQDTMNHSRDGNRHKGRALALSKRAEDAKAANAIIDRLSLPWEGLFSALEVTGSGNVALLGIEPDAARRVVRVTAEARNSTAMLAYLKRLQGTRTLSDVVLVRHEVQTEDPALPVRFVLTGTWGNGR